MTQFLIWSNQKSMWWRPGRNGYTQFIEEAGRYSHTDAAAIILSATVGGMLKYDRIDPLSGITYVSYDEVMVPSPNPWVRTPEALLTAANQAQGYDSTEPSREAPAYRTGGHWKRTLIEVGAGPEDAEGRRQGDRLVGVVDTEPLAERIVALLNADANQAEVQPEMTQNSPICGYSIRWGGVDGTFRCELAPGHDGPQHREGDVVWTDSGIRLEAQR